MKILVTGNLGYIGTVLTPLLVERGHEVVGADSGLFTQSSFGHHVDHSPTVPLDVRDIPVGSDLFDGVDAVIHLAGLANDPLGDLRPECTDEINHRGAVSVAEAAKQAGVSRFVFSSSCSVYGAAAESDLTEESPLNPVTPYGRSKIDAENSLRRLADDSFSPVYLRNGTVFGLSPRIRFDLVVNNLVAWAYATGVVRLKSAGLSWRPMVHVADVARAMVAMVEADRSLIHDEVINVSNPAANHRICDIAETVARAVPGSRVDYAEDACPDVRTYSVDVSKLETRFPDAVPRLTVRHGADEVFAACCKHGLTIDDFEGARYARVAHLESRRVNGDIDDTYRPVAVAV